MQVEVVTVLGVGAVVGGGCSSTVILILTVTQDTYTDNDSYAE